MCVRESVRRGFFFLCVFVMECFFFGPHPWVTQCICNMVSLGPEVFLDPAEEATHLLRLNDAMKQGNIQLVYVKFNFIQKFHNPKED